MVTFGDSPGEPAVKDWCPHLGVCWALLSRRARLSQAVWLVPRSVTAHLYLRVPSTGPLVHGEGCWGCWHMGASRAHGKGDLWLPAGQHRTWRPGGLWKGGDLCLPASGKHGAWCLPAWSHPPFILKPHRCRMTTESPGGSACSIRGTPLTWVHWWPSHTLSCLCPRAAPRGQSGQGRAGSLGQFPGVLSTALLGSDRMSDWLEEAAGHAAPSGGAIVDRTKDGARQGRGRREWTDKQAGDAGSQVAPGWRSCPAATWASGQRLVHRVLRSRGCLPLPSPRPPNLWLEFFQQLWLSADLLLC